MEDDDRIETMRNAAGTGWPVEPPLLVATVPDAAGGGQRYAIEGFLGSGSTGEVWAAEDRLLGRVVAMKVLAPDAAQLPEERAAFLAEARTGGGLRHPNTLPVHDLGFTADGRPWFTMPRIMGRSFAQVIEASRQAQRDPLVPDVVAVVKVMVDTCQALAHAHHHGVVHQDVKPGNILLGPFGEVILVDWGSAVRRGADGRWIGDIVGTPLYMSPEQARRESVDPRSDVYALGGTLLHALLLRQPILEPDEERFWQRKKSGILSDPTEDERQYVPRPLWAIVQRAMHPVPDQRYLNADALNQDLHHWLRGEAIAAWREPWWMRATREWRRRQRTLGPLLAACVMVVALVALLANEWRKERAAWGPPLVVESFTDQAWQRTWADGGGSFAASPRGLTTVVRDRSLAVLSQRLAGPTAIELEVSLAADAPPGEIAIGWLSDATFIRDGRRVASSAGGWWLRLGGADDPAAGIRSRDDGRWVAVLRQGVGIGRTSRIRIEVDGDHMSLSIDGQVCAFTDPFPIGPGWLALAGDHPGKRFSQLRISSLGPPQKLPATAIADHVVGEGRWAAAALEYGRVAEAYPLTKLGREAAYRHALCLLKVNRSEEAFSAWQPLGQSEWAPAIALHRLDAAFAQNDHAAVLSGLNGLAGRPDAAMRWAGWVRELMGRPDGHEQLSAYLAAGRLAFPTDPTAELAQAAAILAMGEGEFVVSAAPNCRTAVAQGLLQNGAFALVADSHKDAPAPWGTACLALAEVTPLLAGGGLPDDADRARIAQGEAELVAANSAVPAMIRAEALCALGRMNEAMLVDPRNDVARILGGRAGEVEDPDWRPVALLVQGRAPEALAAAHVVEETATRWNQPGIVAWPAHALGLEAWARGDRAAAQRRFATDPKAWLRYDDVAFAHLVLPAVLAGLSGDQAAQQAALASVRQHQPRLGGGLWLRLASLAAGVAVPDLSTLSRATGRHGWIAVGQGLAAEHAGDASAARAAYQAWTALDQGQRSGGEPLPITSRFVAWRLAVLVRVPGGR